MAAAIRVKDLVKIYPGGVRGVDGVSFDVESGEIFGLIGPNGSGKTTTLRILATIIKPTSGVAEVMGFDVVKESQKVRQMVAYLPEEAGAYRDLKGIEFLEFVLGMRFRGKDLEAAVEEAAKISGLGRDLYRPVKTYSRGMKRILSVAAVLAQSTPVVILDEPTAGLDVEKSMEVRRIIQTYSRSKGATVILSSHNMLEVEYLCSRVAIIYRGKIVASGFVEELKKAYSARNLEEVFIAAVGGAR